MLSSASSDVWRWAKHGQVSIDVTCRRGIGARVKPINADFVPCLCAGSQKWRGSSSSASPPSRWTTRRRIGGRWSGISPPTATRAPPSFETRTPSCHFSGTPSKGTMYVVKLILAIFWAYIFPGQVQSLCVWPAKKLIRNPWQLEQMYVELFCVLFPTVKERERPDSKPLLAFLQKIFALTSQAHDALMHRAKSHHVITLTNHALRWHAHKMIHWSTMSRWSTASYFWKSWRPGTFPEWTSMVI